MKRHLNTLFVTTQGAYLSREGKAVLVKVDGQTKLRVPIHTLGGIVCFGRVACSPFLLGLCGEQGVAVSFLTERGRFLARAHGFTPGNVHLRREQYRWADDPEKSADVARPVVQAKIANSRTVLQRALRDHGKEGDRERLEGAAIYLGRCLRDCERLGDVDQIRGTEGDAARTYFGVFDDLIRHDHEDFRFTGRSRRPPMDRVNSVLSFLYAMLAHDARAACEAVGLDPAVGFLHRDRPGRPGLALDLVEEFRAILADRVVLSVINRRQIDPGGFAVSPSGAVRMGDDTRKAVLVAYQTRKQEEIVHPFLGEKTTIGLLPHLQARLLARYIRGDLDAYPPFIWK